MTGTVKWFDEKKGFGFLTCEGGHPDVFVHHTAIIGQKGRRNLVEMQAVKFRVESGERGPKAVDVQVI
jgi:cold shock protein